MIIAEVRNHLNSEDGKRSPTSLPTELHSMIVSEVKQITENEFKNIVTSEVKKASLRAPPARYRGSLRGEEMLEIIRTEARQIAKEELLKYSQDKLSVPDFALHSGGAKIISKYTSKTYERWPDKWYKQTFAYLSGQGILRGKPPVTAISHDTNVGQCWPFSGQEGQLAILLNRRVHVTSVTYDHVSKDIAVEIQSAPKDFEVWGIIDDGVGGKDNHDDDEEYDIDNSMRNYMDTNEDYDRMESTEDSCGVRVDGQYEPGKGNNQLPDSDHSSDDELSHLKRQFDNLTYGELRLGSSPLHLYLGKFTYDMHGLPVQTFDIPKHITAHNKPIRAIIMKVKSNWGKPEYTCLYRFRVHGTPA
ncbi:UNC-like C-terminal-domain-containing protein [Glomus cerebriforme]|uniref:UNC-like C-terminal-domain-containing protein n=1 Tax=Glomus cerebriforme TaxID=658196 RepID=A0A397TGP4_9GLOM|nr:UNC-like C-terminal-domain-containing protein [Glomus cerebriforme]